MPHEVIKTINRMAHAITVSHVVSVNNNHVIAFCVLNFFDNIIIHIQILITICSCEFTFDNIVTIFTIINDFMNKWMVSKRVLQNFLFQSRKYVCHDSFLQYFVSLISLSIYYHNKKDLSMVLKKFIKIDDMIYIPS